MATKFWTETEYIQEAALSNLADTDQSGNKVEKVVSPTKHKVLTQKKQKRIK